MISGIVLAAGRAERMGQPKLLLKINGRSLIRAVVDNALSANLDEVIVVVGAEAQAIREELGKVISEGQARLWIVDNPKFESGQSTSLRVGLSAVDPRCEAALVLLGDQPLVGPAVINALIDRYLAGDTCMVYPVYAGQRGAPVLFSRALFAELLLVTGDQGGRQVVAKYLSQGAPVEVSDREVAADVDTWEDYRRISNLRKEEAP